MADEKPQQEAQTEADPLAGSPLAQRVRRAIQAHPILRDQKKLKVTLKGRRVGLEGTVFTRAMHRSLVELISRIEGAEEINFAVDPEIAAPGGRPLEGKVPSPSAGPLPSERNFSTKHLRKPGG